MKKITTLLAIMAAMVATSCHNDDLVAEADGPSQSADKAYVSISITNNSTRADGDTVAGTGDENKIFSLALVTFDKNYDYIGTYTMYAVDNKFNGEVAPDARRFLAVVNPTDEIMASINKISALTQEGFDKIPPIELSAASLSTENYQTNKNETRGFAMSNKGRKSDQGVLTESLVSIDVDLSEEKDKPTPITFEVDRMVSKFNYSVNAAFDTNTETKFGKSPTKVAEGKLLGVALTARNKALNPYSPILKDDLTGGNVYRADHNMAVGQLYVEETDLIAELNANFHWLKNSNSGTDAAFIAPAATAGEVATPEYVLENTCEPAYSNSNNLTQAVVKAQYNPTLSSGTVLTLGTSWFKMYTSDGTGTLFLSFDEVKALYGGSYAGFKPSDATKASMDVQLNHILGTTDKTWADDDVTLTKLNDITYGGYKAATVANESDYILQYYQHAVNYYDIFIQHDEAQAAGRVGRWGMVRNNSYTMDVTGIAQEGLPYIPDPTEPEIVDPENPDPKDPEPADKLNTYIKVSITINPWVLWTQSSELM